MNGVEDPIVES